MRRFLKKSRNLFLLACCCLLLGVGCGKEKEPPTVETLAAELTLNTQSITLIVGEESILSATYNAVKNASLSFLSSDCSVATVDERGKVEAITEGETTVIVSYGEESVTCNVKVWLGEMMPTVSFTQYYAEGVSVGVGESVDFSCEVSFNGKKFQDAVVRYEIEDETVGKIEDGKFRSLQTGNTDVTLFATWRGIELDPLEISVRVLDSFEIYVNQGNEYAFTLYTIDSFGGKEFDVELGFAPTVRKNGETVAATVSVVEGNDVVLYENGKISALTNGAAVVRVAYADDEEYYADFPVSVVLPVAEWEEKLEFSAADGVLPVEKLFWQGAKIVSAMQGEKVLTVAENRVLGVQPNLSANQSQASIEPDSVTVNDTEIIVYTATAGRKISMTAYTKILTTAEDLAALNLSSENPLVVDGMLYGYFVLGGNIAYEETWIPNKHSNLKYNANAGFFGVFDGRGYSLDVNSYGDGGLFGRLGRCCIKNVSVTFREQAKNTGTYGFAYAFGAGTWGKRVYFRNVEVTVENYGAASWQGNASAVFACEVQHYVDMKNVVVHVNFASGKEEKNTGILFLKAKNHSAYITFENVYVISSREDVPLTSKETQANGWAENDGHTENVYKGLKRYADTAAMLADSEKNGNYLVFQNEYWFIANGVPVWKGKNKIV